MRDAKTRQARGGWVVALGDALRQIRNPAWFPQIPLAAALAFSGGHLLWVTFGSTWGALRTGVLATNLIRSSDLPYLLIGAAMMTVSVGLALRSRVAWAFALVLTLSVVVFVVRFGHPYGRYLESFDCLLVVALLLAYRSFDRSVVGGAALVVMIAVVPALTYATFGSFYLGDQFTPPIKSLFTAFYYTVVTMTTVGYGDIVPTTDEARLFAIQVIFLGVGLLATSISAVVGPLVRSSFARVTGQREGYMSRSNHFLIVGATPVAQNAYRELKRRRQTVTVILGQGQTGEFDKDDVVIGDANNVEVLRTANADRARAVVVARADDSESAFIVLAVKELKGSAKTFVVVNDGKHLARVKLVRPDVMMAPDVMGGELLAMALTDEPITGQHLMDRLFDNELGKGDGA